MAPKNTVNFTDEDFPPLPSTRSLLASASSGKKLVAKSSPASSLSSLSSSTSSAPSSAPSSTSVSTPKESPGAVSSGPKLDDSHSELSDSATQDNDALEKLWPDQTDTVRKKRDVTFEEAATVLPSLKHKRPGGTVAPFHLADIEHATFVGLARLFPQDCPEALIIQSAKTETGGVDMPEHALPYDYAVVFGNNMRMTCWRHAIDVATLRCAIVAFPPVVELHEKAMMMVADRSGAEKPKNIFFEVPVVRAMTGEEFEKLHGLKTDRVARPSLGWFYSEVLVDCCDNRRFSDLLKVPDTC